MCITNFWLRHISRCLYWIQYSHLFSSIRHIQNRRKNKLQILQSKLYLTENKMEQHRQCACTCMNLDYTNIILLNMCTYMSSVLWIFVYVWVYFDCAVSCVLKTPSSKQASKNKRSWWTFLLFRHCSISFQLFPNSL